METSKLNKARTGVFLLLIAISLYSLFMISASNTSYAAGQSLFKFSSLIGLSPSANGYDRQKFVNNISEKLIASSEKLGVPNINIGNTRVSAFDEGEVASFLSSPRKSNFRRIVSGATSSENKRSGITGSKNLLSFSGGSAGLSTGLVSQCIQSLKPDMETEQLNVDEVIACIFNSDGGLADNGNNPFENDGGNGTQFDDGIGSNGGGTGTGANGDGTGTGTNGDGTGTGTNGDGTGTGADGDGTGTNGDGILVAEVPEPSTYMLLGLGMMTLVGFSRKKTKARIS